MFCDQCHWYTAGEKICPHCGAPQEPPEPEDAFGLKRPAPPKPEPEPAPVVIPAPPPVVRPVTVPPPAPYVRPKPAPTMSDSNKKGLKALAIVLAGVVVLVIVMLIAERASDDPYAFNEYENPYYEDYEYSTEPAPEVGDVLFFGNAQWRAADEDASGTALLLLREDE
ncbi:MAG: hypothetical protein FWC27_04930, partial [Firmicutes bacterium]|nr:hypothetical protein [Bacillota bacterium]